jgi:phage-related protein
LNKGIVRLIFTVEDDTMILLHGFVKKSAKIPPAELKTAKARLAQLRGSK